MEGWGATDMRRELKGFQAGVWVEKGIYIVVVRVGNGIKSSI